jgi:hypothetical protein
MRRSYDRNWAWRIVELAMAGCAAGGVALSEREVQRQMLAEGKDLGKKYVRSCLTRFYESGDPHTTRDSDRRDPRRATETQRKWMKRLLKAEPHLYFDEVANKFKAKFRRTITDEMISQAIHYDGGMADDRPLSLKALQVLARQRCTADRMECKLGLQGLNPECMIILDESHAADKTARRRRGWAPVGEPAHIYEYFGQDGTLRSVLAAVNRVPAPP